MWFDIAKKSSLFRAALIIRRMYVFPASTFAVKVSEQDFKNCLRLLEIQTGFGFGIKPSVQRIRLGPLVEQG